MVYINFTEKRIFKQLLNKKKEQTIREVKKYERKGNELYLSKHKYKVGESYEIKWEGRKTSKIYFCKKCMGGLLLLVDNNQIEFCPVCKGSFGFAPKLIGKAVITHAFYIIIVKQPDKTYKVFLKNRIELNAESLAKADGFNSAKEMFDCLHKIYNLELPKYFHVYRWDWLI